MDMALPAFGVDLGDYFVISTRVLVAQVAQAGKRLLRVGAAACRADVFEAAPGAEGVELGRVVQAADEGAVPDGIGLRGVYRGQGAPRLYELLFAARLYPPAGVRVVGFFQWLASLSVVAAS
jgi:hypothetical protein